ncbi:MAG: tRNA (guanosine(46)-N7)-methyltransferase TrmB [Clostridia bacterium]|nr:tRNA (guanosine(46)-N7)-methyltransferase TrmB [Clostridia bacterium]
MRARRKKHLDERAKKRGDYIVVSKTSKVLSLPESERYDVKTVNDLFQNDNDLVLEIGCGKGGFIIKNAEIHTELNFLGVEVQLNVIISGAELASKKNLNNVKFFNCGAEILPYELEKGSVSKLYLNFSCPYPKKQYENHRLTYYSFLNIYKYLLKKGATIELKTDNDAFFEYSVNSLIENGFEITYLTNDLHSGDTTGNVTTEYEEKFVSLGKNIHKLIARGKP